MRQHPAIGERILADVPGFENIAIAVRHEHERWDGAGYPDGLAGDEIPLASRIVLVCDAYHAMTSNRPYRDAMPDEDARAELKRNAGTQFDSKVVTALLDALDEGLMRGSQDAVSGDQPAGVDAETSAGKTDAPARPIADVIDVDPGNDHVRMMRAAAINWLLSAAVLSGYLVAFSKVDLFGIVAFAGAFVIVAVSPWVARPRLAKAWFEATALFAFIAAPLMAAHYQEPVMMLFLVAPATFVAGFFWRSRPVRTLLIVAVTFEFAILPIVLFGFDQFAFALVGTRAFAGAVLVIGYLSVRMSDLRFERERFSSTAASLLLALHARDEYTAEHSDETAETILDVAERLGFSTAAWDELVNISTLREIGKIGIPEEVLRKPGELDESEWEIVRQHPVIGEQIVAQVPGYAAVARAIRHEHERWDGGGYPDGLAGREIPLASRIVFVCNAFYAMTSDRPYRSAMSAGEARAELLSNAGTQFDPAVVTALLGSLDDSGITFSAQKPADLSQDVPRHVSAA